MNWQDLISAHGHLFTNPNKRTFSAEEMAIAYRIINSHDGSSIIDTGCHSCRRSALTRVRKIISRNNQFP